MKIKKKVNFFRDCGVSDENPNSKPKGTCSERSATYQQMRIQT